MSAIRRSRILAFTTTRRDGDAKRPAVLAKLLRAHKLSQTIATAQQVHGTRIQVVPRLRAAQRYAKTDGLLSDIPNQPLGIYTADCASIFLSAPSYGLIGLLHAGWRGVVGGILPKALRIMARRWRCRPQDVRVSIGPCIRACCFEVQWDVARHFPATRRRRKDRWVVDLGGEIERQARRSGAQIDQTKRSVCTLHPSIYHSFRRNQTKERQISVISKNK